ncbi:hypothetical protein J3A83DRAFT_4098237, partial [Scleroderma citrinum]
IQRFLNTKDSKSTDNLHKLIKSYWGIDVMNTANDAKDTNDIWMKIVNGILQNRLIIEAFKRKRRRRTYSNQPHTPTETRTEIVHWVAKNLQPFHMVGDHDFQSLMKTGRPAYYLPSVSTIA